MPVMRGHWCAQHGGVWALVCGLCACESDSTLPRVEVPLGMCKCGACVRAFICACLCACHHLRVPVCVPSSARACVLAPEDCRVEEHALVSCDCSLEKTRRHPLPVSTRIVHDASLTQCHHVSVYTRITHTASRTRCRAHTASRTRCRAHTASRTRCRDTPHRAQSIEYTHYHMYNEVTQSIMRVYSDSA